MSKGRILVVEDNADNLELVSFLLEQAGYEVTQASDGRAGLDEAHKTLPDMMLLDMSIPEVDGWSVARQIKNDPETRSICIVALTGHTLPGDRKKALDAGCDGYITKPLYMPIFVEQVDAYIEKHRSKA